jgi:hypothetical protein
MGIRDAVAQVNQFKGDSLAQTIATLETRLTQAGTVKADVIQTLGVTLELLLAAADVKRASAQISVVIHAVGILYALPHILEEGEFVERLSLGASSARSEFDLETDRRIAEFKFIHWQEKGNAVRNKTLFQDYFKLAREKTSKSKYLYLLETEIPLRFLKGDRDVLKVLDRNRRLADAFIGQYGQKYRTVGEYYRAHRDEVQIVELVKRVPDFDRFMQVFQS